MILKRHDYTVNNKPAAIVLRWLEVSQCYYLECQRSYKQIWSEVYVDQQQAENAFRQEAKLRTIQF